MKTLVYIFLSVFWLSLTFAHLDSNVELFKSYPDSCTSAKPKKNGIYKIKVNGQIMPVYCDVALTGSPWLVIQRRVDVSVNFYRNWSSYQEGFGDLEKSFFIGLNTLNTLTVSKSHQLYVHLEDFEGQKRFARYDRFAIGNEANMYGLNTLGTYSGTAGDGLRFHQNAKFSTYDRNNGNITVNRAARYTGAWWYNTTHNSNLNGLYFGGDYGVEQSGRGITWNYWRGNNYSYKTVHMMIRPN
ncbi:fibrinogen-like protein 1 [Drosophila innubila]|uniref:fibrinogen-like protein 1 n=1 Tax=Drosophila innubila TaxID=198719 RepID=UPI00148E4E92|nr:fibrinogen-like protein 1 [Drosophila innubila]